MSNFSQNKEIIKNKIKDNNLKEITDKSKQVLVCSVLGFETSCVIYDKKTPVSVALADSIEAYDVDEFLEGLNLNYNPKNSSKSFLKPEIDSLSEEISF